MAIATSNPTEQVTVIATHGWQEPTGELAESLAIATQSWDTRLADLDAGFFAQEPSMYRAPGYDVFVATYQRQRSELERARALAVDRARRAADPQAMAIRDAVLAGRLAYQGVMDSAEGNTDAKRLLHGPAVEARNRAYAVAYRRAGGLREGVGTPEMLAQLDMDLSPRRFPGTPGVIPHNNAWALVLKGVKPSELDQREIPMFWGWRGAILRSAMAVAQEPAEVGRHNSGIGDATGNEPIFVELASPLPRRLQGVGRATARTILSRARLLDQLDVDAAGAGRHAANKAYDDTVAQLRHNPSLGREAEDALIQSNMERAKAAAADHYLEQQGMLGIQQSPLQRLADAAIRFVFLQ